MRPPNKTILAVAASIALIQLGAAMPMTTHGQSADSTADAKAKRRPTTLDAVVVSATRTNQAIRDVPANVVVLGADIIATSAAKTVSDLLRIIPGYTMKDFQSTLVSHPSRQAPALRGLGGTSASRTLVLLDGIPINEPFAGWMHWSRIPLAFVRQAEVVRGGGSVVWGDRALGGVINLITAEPRANSLSLTAAGGSFSTVRTSAVATVRRDRLGLLLAGDYSETDGYLTVRPNLRSAIDTKADSRAKVFYGKALYDVTPLLQLHLGGSYLDDYRHNGTVLRDDATTIGDVRGGLRLVTRDGSVWTANAYTSRQNFTQLFTSESADRSTETPSLDQFDVPATAHGAQIQWSRQALGRHQLSAGGDLSFVDGEVNEDFNYQQGKFIRRRHVAGQQMLTGGYIEDALTLSERWRLLASVRYDSWQNRSAIRTERDIIADRLLLDTSYARTTRSRVSSSLGVRHQTSSALSFRGSAYSSFRAPTLNELYKPFREPGNVLVEGNPKLSAERLLGVDLGADYAFSPAMLIRATGFWNRIHDPILDVTVELAGSTGRQIAPCGFVPAGGVCRNRRNLDEFRTLGVEAEIEARPHRFWTLRGSYLWNPTKITKAEAQPALVGKAARGTAKQQYMAMAAFDNPDLLDFNVTTRYVGSRFEDDLSVLGIEPFYVTDIKVGRRLVRRTHAFVSVENVFDREYTVTRASNGFERVGGPRFIEGGVQVRF